MRTLTFLSIAIFLFLSMAGASSYSDEDIVLAGTADSEVQAVIRLVNAKRHSLGCPELRWDDRLAALARGHSRDMVSRNFLSHTNPDGQDPFDRMREANVRFSVAAENIATGARTGRKVYELWLNSPDHRKNMLDCRFTRHGIGRAGDRWTHIFLKP